MAKAMTGDAIREGLLLQDVVVELLVNL